MATSSRRLRHATRAAFGALLVIGTLVPATSSSAAATPTLAVGDGSVVEGGKSSREVLVPVTLSAPATVKTTFRYNVIAGTAAAGTDFKAVSNKKLTFAPGTVEKVIKVKVLGDNTNESNETIAVKLSGVAGGAVLGRSTGTVTIIEDGPGTSLAVGVGDVSVVEGASGSSILDFPVTLNQKSKTSTVSVTVATENSTATAGSDYVAVSPRTLVFPPNTFKQTVSVTVARDALPEVDETFKVKLSNESGAAVVRRVGIGTIIADDPITTSTTLASNPNPSPAASPATLTATVSSGPGTPSGTVQFFDGVTSLGTAPLVGGTAHRVTSSLAPGPHSLRATYLGSGVFQPSSSSILAHDVGDPTGPIFGWGANSSGRIGDGTTFVRTTPTPIGADTDWAKVSAGAAHTEAIKGDGTLWGWGSNNPYGQVGNGVQADQLSPVQIGTDSDWRTVDAGYTHTLAIKTSGSLWAWGANSYGQLGDNWACGVSFCLSPVHIGSSSWSAASAGVQHSLAVRSDGTLWAWGDNTVGQLGDGQACSTFRCLTPVQVGTDTHWVSVSAGSYFSVGRKTDGTLWAWGANDSGQLGDGTTTNRLTPVQVGTDSNWASVSAGNIHTAATKTDGTVWTWGPNSSFELGHSPSTVPVQVGTDTNWASVSAGWFHTVALKTNGELWAWGTNTSGQIGDGPPFDFRISPVHVGTGHWLAVDAGAAHTEAIGD
jgi:hypothetical protein